jgi:putative addiction module component (TIGR02574 family)
MRSGTVPIRPVSDLFGEVARLTVAEKIELLEAVWESLEADAIPLTAAQRAELDRRLANYERTTAATSSWNQVKADLLHE